VPKDLFRREFFRLLDRRHGFADLATLCVSPADIEPKARLALRAEPRWSLSSSTCQRIELISRR
jgi:hypothetical protein